MRTDCRRRQIKYRRRQTYKVPVYPSPCGPGQSDDAAIVASGLLYNVDVALGVFLADAIDTLEKYVSIYRDQDNNLARYIKENYTFLDAKRRTPASFRIWRQ